MFLYLLFTHRSDRAEEREDASLLLLTSACSEEGQEGSKEVRKERSVKGWKAGRASKEDGVEEKSGETEGEEKE